MDLGITFEGIPWDEVAPGARERRATRGDVCLRLLELTPSFEERGWCTRGHSGIVLEGRMELVLRTGASVLNAGEGFVLRPGEEGAHRARALSERVLLFLVETSSG